MKITTIDELKAESYLMNDFEICIHSKSKLRRNFACATFSCPMEYNYSNKSILIFSDERNKNYVVLYFEGILDILSKAGYHRNSKLIVPGFDKGWYPESKEKWERIKKRIASIEY